MGKCETCCRKKEGLTPEQCKAGNYCPYQPKPEPEPLEETIKKILYKQETIEEIGNNRLHSASLSVKQVREVTDEILSAIKAAGYEKVKP